MPASSLPPHMDRNSMIRLPESLAQNLPASRTPIVGRDDELAAIHQTLVDGRYRLVTLTGVGGCGKTRLATTVAAAIHPVLADGVWFVDLASISDEALLADTIAAALELPLLVDGATVDAVIVFLRRRAALLVLDNCEHLIDGCAVLVEQLLTACPHLRVLATSREPLQIPGERQRRIGPLTLPDPAGGMELNEAADSPAVQLFVERAQDGAPDFHLTTDNASVVAAICIRLDGIPLALELAAARVRMLSVEQILARLDEMFQLLSGSSRTAPTRQQTLRATLDWSYDLLTPGEQVVFRRLSVFASGCDIEAAEAVGVGDEINAAVDRDEVVDLITRLVDKSLIGVHQRPPTAWYRMLEPVRQYGIQRLTAAAEMDAALARHAAYYLDLALRAEPALSGPSQVEWLERLEGERDNLRNALLWAAEHGEADMALRMAVALFHFWEARDYLTEGRGWLEQAIQASRSSNSAESRDLRVKALRCAGRLAHQQRDLSAAESFHSESLGLARELNDQLGIAAALSELAMEARLAGRLEQSTALAEESLTLCDEIGDHATTAYALLESGITWKDRGDLAQARQYLNESLAMYQTLGDVRFIAITQAMLGLTALKANEPASAEQHLRSAIAGHHRLGNRWFVIYDLQWLATAILARGEPRQAALLLGAAHGLGDALGEVITPIGGANAAALAAQARVALGDTTFAAAWGEGLLMSREQAVATALAAPDTHEKPVRSISGSPGDDTRLTRRELQVASLLARGYRDRQIADELSISVATVGVHVHRVLGKLGIRSRWQVGEALADTSQGQQTTQT